jgi:hypothetical protein
MIIRRPPLDLGEKQVKVCSLTDEQRSSHVEADVWCVEPDQTEHNARRRTNSAQFRSSVRPFS